MCLICQVLCEAVARCSGSEPTMIFPIVSHQPCHSGCPYRRCLSPRLHPLPFPPDFFIFVFSLTLPGDLFQVVDAMIAAVLASSASCSAASATIAAMMFTAVRLRSPYAAVASIAAFIRRRFSSNPLRKP